MESVTRNLAQIVLLAAILWSATWSVTAARASDPKLATKLGVDSTRFALTIDAKQKPTAGKTFKATVHVTPGPTWHVWSASMSQSGGLSPLRIRVPESIAKYFEITAIRETGKIIVGYDSNFESETKGHGEPYDIITTIKVRDNATAPVPFCLYVFFQTCNETMCMPPRTFAVPMVVLGEKPIDLTIAHGKADTTIRAGGPVIEMGDKSSLMRDVKEDRSDWSDQAERRMWG